MENTFYVFSTGRSGTTYLARILEYHLNLSNLHQDKYSRIINVLANAMVSAPFPIKIFIKYIKIIYPNKILNSTCDPLKSIAFSLLYNSSSLRSKPRFVHLVRDPRDVVTSFMNWKNRKLKSIFLHHFVPFWMPIPSNNIIKSFSYITYRKFEHFCWIWNYKNRIFENICRKNENSIRIRFEDIVSNPQKIKEVIDFIQPHKLDIEIFKNKILKINTAKKNTLPKWNHWSKKQAKILNNHCGKLMEKYSYGNEREWKEKIK